ncbi:uncharacterized protein LOC124316431 [Daphnia pulicaria]|uniref:uncharacterized protein LOC124316431 n=1 Tax=Daphnia pulicaria TaxID=35523 RepID=UPI001EEC98F1|nr:uncharacterized protein LOC124316431 [Daphnia pulicaria]
MKLALSFFLAVLVVMSHQQFQRNPYHMMFDAFPWLSPLPRYPVNPAFYYDYETATVSIPSNLKNDDVYPVENNRNVFSPEDEGEEYADTQSRVKGFSLNRPRPSSQQDDDQQNNARFLYNIDTTTARPYNHPFFKTATFTSTVTLSLNSIQNCVPANEVIANVQPCQPNQQAIVGRRRRDNVIDDFSYLPEDTQFPPINPSNTFNLMPTVLSNLNDDNLDLLSSSMNDIDLPNLSRSEDDQHNFREKRFFINKNRFVALSVSTSFVFVNSTIRATVNLLNPVPAPGAGPCVPVPAIPAPVAPAVPVTCVGCLPPDFVVCPPPVAG